MAARCRFKLARAQRSLSAGKKRTHELEGCGLTLECSQSGERQQREPQSGENPHSKPGPHFHCGGQCSHSDRIDHHPPMIFHVARICRSGAERLKAQVSQYGGAKPHTPTTANGTRMRLPGAGIEPPRRLACDGPGRGPETRMRVPRLLGPDQTGR